MPTYEEDYLKIKNARDKQGQMNKQSADLAAGAQTFGDRVKAKVREKMAASGMDKLSQDYGRATGQLVSEPAAMRARMADVNPLQVDALTAKQTGQTLDTLTSTSEFQKLRDASITDVIDSSTNKILAQAAQKKAEADKAQQEADSLIEEIRLRMDQQKASMSGESKQTVNLPGFGDVQLTDSQIASLWSSGKLGGSGLDQKTQQEYSSVSKIINQLKDMYYGQEGSEDDLSRGRLGGAFSNVKSWIGMDSDVKNYNRTKDGIVSTLKGLVGESGVLSDEDTKRLKSLLPKTTDTMEEAKEQWKEIDNLLNNKYGLSWQITGVQE